MNAGRIDDDYATSVVAKTVVSNELCGSNQYPFAVCTNTWH